MERTVQPGTFYRHFKDKFYQIVTIAYHSETGEPMVVYQALYGDYRSYVRPLAMFLSEVDREKYPDCPQQYRFEQVEFRLADTAAAIDNAKAPHQELSVHAVQTAGAADAAHIENTSRPNKYLLEFLEAETITAKLEVLAAMKGHVRPAELESICLTLDIPFEAGDMEKQIESVRRVLKMRQHYDGRRLRS